MRPHFLVLPMVVLAACSAPDGFTPAPVPEVSTTAPVEVLVDDIPEITPSADYSAWGGPDDPSRGEMGPVRTSSTRVPFLHLQDLSLRDAARTLVVEHLGLAVMYASSDEPPVVTFSGGPFDPADALDAFEDLVRAQGLSFRRVGDLVVISDGSDRSTDATGYTRVYRTDASAVAEAVGALYGQVTARAVGRSVAFAGPSSAVEQSIELVQGLDRDAVSSLPWAVLRLSPKVAEQAEGIVAALSEDASPLSLTTHAVDDAGVVLLVGHSRASVDEAVAVLRAVEQGRPQSVSRTLAVSDPSSAAEVLRSTFADEISAGELKVGQTTTELVLRGQPVAVSAAYALADDLHGGLDYVEVRAIVAETTRGSVVDRALSLGVSGSDIGMSLGGSVDANSIGAAVGSFRAAVSWLDRDADTRLLATPRLSVVSGGTADLSVGSQVPILGEERTRDDGSTSRSVEYRDTGVLLRVSPVVLSDGRISVSLSQELSTAGTNALTALDSPLFDQRRLVTDLVLERGEMVAAGGLDYSVAEVSQSGPVRMGSTGTASTRKMVVLLTADVRGTDDRRRAVDEAVSGLSSILRIGGRG